MVHADNIWEIIKCYISSSKSNYYNNIVKNIETFSKFLGLNDIQRIVTHNYIMLAEDPEVIKQKFDETYQNATDNKDFKEKLEAIINSNFNLTSQTHNTDKESSKFYFDTTESDSYESPNEQIELDSIKNLPYKEDKIIVESTKTSTTAPKTETTLDEVWEEINNILIYLNSNIGENISTISSNTIGSILSIIGRENNDPSYIGKFKRKLKALKTKLQFLKDNDMLSEELNQSLNNILKLAKSRLTDLDNEIKTCEDFTTEIYVNEKTTTIPSIAKTKTQLNSISNEIKESENQNTNAEIDDINQEIEDLLIRKISKIKSLSADRATSRSDAIKLESERLAHKQESENLNSLIAMLGENIIVNNSESSINAVSDIETLKTRVNELKDLYENTRKEYIGKYHAPELDTNAKLDGYHKKLYEKLMKRQQDYEEAVKELERLEKGKSSDTTLSV